MRYEGQFLEKISHSAQQPYVHIASNQNILEKCRFVAIQRLLFVRDLMI